jgi:hypothetical protein
MEKKSENETVLGVFAMLVGVEKMFKHKKGRCPEPDSS